MAKVAKKLQILSLIKVGRTIKKNNISDAILADCFEAFVGAIYLDFKNLGFVRQFLHQHLINAN
ncbi:MAG: ribonuclease III domain-containing protein [Mollicutes bacterium]|nr:MAG: ribonuclease III domain-containing protein [Mollicutes bacterium]